MKHILYIILTLFNFTVFGQSVEFELFLRSGCNDSIFQADYYTMYPINDSTMKYHSDSNGKCILPDTGSYRISIIESIAEFDLNIYIKRRGKQYDTLRIMTINECYEPTSRPDFIGFCYCDQKCDGYQVDYYSNGNKRIEGTFKDAKPIGKLNYFYPSGKLKRVEKYTNSGDLIIVYTFQEKDFIKNINKPVPNK